MEDWCCKISIGCGHVRTDKFQHWKIDRHKRTIQIVLKFNTNLRSWTLIKLIFTWLSIYFLTLKRGSTVIPWNVKLVLVELWGTLHASTRHFHHIKFWFSLVHIQFHTLHSTSNFRIWQPFKLWIQKFEQLFGISSQESGLKMVVGGRWIENKSYAKSQVGTCCQD